MPTFIRELHDDLPVLVIAGELDISTQEEFRDALKGIDEDAPKITLDFCKCGYFDSSTLTELIRFRNQRQDRQQIVLSVPNPSGKHILQITGLDQVFTITDCSHVASQNGSPVTR